MAFPREGEGLKYWHSLDCTVVSIVAPKSLPPSGGRWLAGGQTDEGEAEGLHNFPNYKNRRKKYLTFGSFNYIVYDGRK